MAKKTATKTARRANGTILPKAKAAKGKTARAAKGKATKAAKAAPAKAGTKTEALVAMLKNGATAEAMMKTLGWLPHTLRAAISILGKKHGLKVGRTRADGVTTYKTA